MELISTLHKVVGPALRVVAPSVRPYGMHPLAWALYRQAGISPWRVGQTIGNALASAGTYCKVGEYQGHDYGACFDLRVSDLGTATIVQQIVRPLAALGIAAYVRIPGHDHWPASDARHVHCIYAGANMTEQVEHQVKDWLNEAETLNGLASHVKYTLYQTTHDERAACQAVFATHKVISH